MKKTTSISSFLLVAAGTSSAFGFSTLQGSDTLEVLTQNMIARCSNLWTAPLGGAGNPALVYIGGGSTTGETGMRGTGTGGVSQVIAPMSRSLRDSPQTPDLCPDDVNPGVHQLAVARDALVVVTNGANIAGCDDLRRETAPALNVTDRNGIAGVDCPGCVGTMGPKPRRGCYGCARGTSCESMSETVGLAG